MAIDPEVMAALDAVIALREEWFDRTDAMLPLSERAAGVGVEDTLITGDRIVAALSRLADALSASRDAAYREGWNAALEEAAHAANIRARVFGGEPTTRNEQQIVEHIATAILSLRTKASSHE